MLPSAMLAAALLVAAQPVVRHYPVAQIACMPGEGPAWLRLWGLTFSTNAGRIIHPGAPFTIALRPIAQVDTRVPPRQAARGATKGAVLGLRVRRAGTYGVAINDGAWIELIRDGRPVRSAAHHHGPATCSTVRKVVDFRLEPGRYTIQLSGTDAASVLLFVFRR
jgi:hypothetical protein